MSKNKFLRRLLVGGLCALTATAMIGATACDKDKGNDNPEGEKPPITQTEQFTVTFALNGGTWDYGKTSIKVDKDGTLPADLPNPTNGDKNFGGWYNGTSPINPDTFKVTEDVTLTAHWTDPQPVEAKKIEWTLTNIANDQKIDKGEEIVSNDLFTVKSSVDVTKATASAKLTDSKSAESGLKTTALKYGEYEQALYSITAIANTTVTVYLHVANDGWSSHRPGAEVTYSLGSEAVYVEKSENRDVKALCITASIPQGETLSIGLHNVNTNNNQEAKIWLFEIDAIEEDKDAVLVNYYYGQSEGENAKDLLISSQFAKAGDTITAPKSPVIIDDELELQFVNWYAADGETEYTFGAITADGASIYAKFEEPEGTVHTYTFDHSKITVSGTCVGTEDTSTNCPTDAIDVTQEQLGTENSFLTVIASGENNNLLKYRDGNAHKSGDKTSTSPTCIEIRGEALTVTFQGTGTLKIAIASTGGSNYSSIAVKNASGSNVTATYSSGNATDENGVYAVLGTAYVEFTFTITEAGVYTIYTVDTVNTEVSTGRNTRVNAIVMNDWY